MDSLMKKSPLEQVLFLRAEGKSLTPDLQAKVNEAKREEQRYQLRKTGITRYANHWESIQQKTRTKLEKKMHVI